MSDHTEGWITAGDYQLSIHEGRIIAKNAKGKELKTVPAKVKKTPEYDQLTGLLTVLTQHDDECKDNVVGWFLGGHSIPVIALQQVWPDPIWRKYLHNLVITDGTVTGLLRDITESGVAVADLDGESVEISSESITIPHPAIIDDIDEWREFSTELGATQGIDQLFREIHEKPADAKTQREAVSRYRDATFEKVSHLIGRARRGGFKTDMYSANIDVEENGKTITASLELMGYYADPDDEGSLGSLSFFFDKSEMKLEEVGPIAWSEGIRMCEYIYAGRKVEAEES